jgi:hypothetical protein
MELINYRITESSKYGWTCYGANAYMLSSWNGVHGKGGYSFEIVFSTKSQKVYEVSVCDYTNNRAYRIINPDYIKKFEKENSARGLDANRAWDEIEYIDLDVEEDFMEKARAIWAGEPYDARVMMNIDLDADLELDLYRRAHAADMTLNEFVVKILTELAKQHGAELA